MTNENQPKGMIAYPCCKKEKVLVYNDCRGHVSNKCPRCGKYAVFDFCTMTAVQQNPVRGATSKYQMRYD